MLLQIRNMESSRCIATVNNELNKLGLHHNTVELGKVVLKGNISSDYLKMLDIALKTSGLEIINNRNSLLIEKIKEAINQLIDFPDDLPKPIISDYISKKVNRDYTFLSNLFSNELGVTIEKYIISKKIECVKVLLIYHKLSLNDIAYKLRYSSVAHLSNQFKKITGLTPTFFRQNRNSNHYKLLNV
jgi:AraC-like DNA-binding protein